MKGVSTNSHNQKGKRLISYEQREVDSFFFQRLDAILLKKYSRLFALYQTSLYLFQTEGIVSLTKRTYRFLRGERHNSKILIPHKSYKHQHKKRAYKRWIAENEMTKNQIQSQHIAQAQLEYRPLISVFIVIKNNNRAYLEQAIHSVLKQTYTNWEIHLICSIYHRKKNSACIDKYLRLDKRIRADYINNSTEDLNEVITRSKGDFITFLGDEDEIAVNAFYENAHLLNQFSDADIIYSDEDKLDEKNQRYEPYFKPDWSPDLFYSSLYTANMSVYRKSLFDKVGGLNSNADAIQYIELMLRLLEETNQIFHIPKVLYHCRKTKISNTSEEKNREINNEALMNAFYQHFKRLEIDVEITNGLTDDLLRVKRKLSNYPKVSIIIPTKDNLKFLHQCVKSIKQHTTYPNYEIIIVNNNSSDITNIKYLEDVCNEKNIVVVHYNEQFNFAAINNFAVEVANGELVLFLNDDTKVISDEWLESMVEHALRPEVGAVGARLLYSNGTVQHAGVITGIGGVAGHSHKHLPNNHPGYFGRAKAVQNLSAVTAACMMVKKSVFKYTGGFDEENLAIAYNDIDFCLKLRKQGLLIVYTPYAELYHYESVSRGTDQNQKTSSRFQKETNFMKFRWKEILDVDPYYNPNLTMEKENFSLSNVQKVD